VFGFGKKIQIDVPDDHGGLLKVTVRQNTIAYRILKADFGTSSTLRADIADRITEERHQPDPDVIHQPKRRVR
jgi:hypothetical protein